jgi:uncharacterized protein (DUF2147 family)
MQVRPSAARLRFTGVRRLRHDLLSVRQQSFGMPISIVRTLGNALLAALAVAFCSAAAAGDPTPLGTWTTIDDVNHHPRSLVEISEADGVVSGRIVHLFQAPGEDPDPRCVDCNGERHGQPVLGMTILWNLRRHGDSWDGGEILDPESGSIYRVTLHPEAGGDRLEVRGYIGFSLLGRTQVWERAPAQ